VRDRVSVPVAGSNRLDRAGATPAVPALVGTQAPPVDASPKRGRPRIHPDRKAYNAMKQREYRARKKEGP